jgi:hypothetical protein
MMTIIDPDHLPYLGFFFVGLAVAMSFGAFLFARARSLLLAERFGLLLCPAAVYVTLLLTANTFFQTLDNSWNNARLTPAIAFLHGIKIYVSPTGPGAVMDTIYPPMAYLSYLPAGLFSTPTSAMLAGSCISVALFFTPALLLCFSRRGDDHESRFSIIGIALLLGLAQASIMSKAMLWGAFFIHADAPMFGYAAFACLTLYFQRGEATLTLKTCLISAFCASLAVWSKQTAAPLVAILPIWVLIAHGFRAAVRFTFWLIVALVSLSFAFRMLFGISSFLFNIFKIPSEQPWNFQGPQLAKGFLLLSVEYFCVAAMFLAPILLTLVARWVFTPVEVTETEEEAGPRREETSGPRLWISRDYWLLFVVMAFAAVPTSLLSRIKFGGSWNNYGPTTYFLSLGLIALVMEWYATNRQRGLRLFNAGLTLIMLVLVLSPLSKCGEDNFVTFNTIHPLMPNANEDAYRYSLRHPGTAYFPFHPVSSLLGEGKVYHHLFGMVDREWAGHPLTAKHFREHLPANLKYICVPPFTVYGYYQSIMIRLPEYSKRVDIPELPGWICYER